jgi:hypothetical protein
MMAPPDKILRGCGLNLPTVPYAIVEMEICLRVQACALAAWVELNG